MFDINTIINNAITEAVQEALRGYTDEIVALNRTLSDTIGELDTLKQRIKALEAKPVEPLVVDEAKMVEALNSQEWFWDKLATKTKEIADAAVEEAIDDHCSNYDHDDYDRAVSKLDDLEDNNSLREAIQDILSDASLSIRF